MSVKTTQHQETAGCVGGDTVTINSGWMKGAYGLMCKDKYYCNGRWCCMVHMDNEK